MSNSTSRKVDVTAEHFEIIRESLDHLGNHLEERMNQISGDLTKNSFQERRDMTRRLDAVRQLRELFNDD